MKCYSFSIDMETKGQVQISNEEVAMIKKKEHHYGMLVFLIAGIVVISLGGIASLFDDPEHSPILCIFLLLFALLLIAQKKDRVAAACYAVVTGKEIRHAKLYGRSSPSMMPYEKTEDGEVVGRRFHITHEERNFYYCSVKINEHEYEEICCYKDDFDKIGIGSKVIVAVLNNRHLPVAYAIQ